MNHVVSIIIPFYNASPYLDSAIRSALAQTWPEKEIILVDDGSTDGSLAIAKKYEGAAVKVFSQENRGAAAARNYGIRESRGSYFQFLDADDLLSPEKITRQLNVLKSYPEHLAVCNCIHFFSDEDPFKKMPGDESEFVKNSDHPVEFLTNLYGASGHGWMVPLHSWLTPASCIKKAGLWNEELTLDDDGEYFCRAVLSSKGIRFSEAVFSYYRKYHASKSISASSNYSAMKSLLKSTELKYEHLKSRSDSPEIDKAIARLLTEASALFYPGHKSLYREAVALIGKTGITYFPLPSTGGRAFNLIRSILGWKIARRIQVLYNQVSDSK